MGYLKTNSSGKSFELEDSQLTTFRVSTFQYQLPEDCFVSKDYWDELVLKNYLSNNIGNLIAIALNTNANLICYRDSSGLRRALFVYDFEQRKWIMSNSAYALTLSSAYSGVVISKIIGNNAYVQFFLGNAPSSSTYGGVMKSVQAVYNIATGEYTEPSQVQFAQGHPLKAIEIDSNFNHFIVSIRASSDLIRLWDYTYSTNTASYHVDETDIKTLSGLVKLSSGNFLHFGTSKDGKTIYVVLRQLGSSGFVAKGSISIPVPEQTVTSVGAVALDDSCTALIFTAKYESVGYSYCFVLNHAGMSSISIKSSRKLEDLDFTPYWDQYGVGPSSPCAISYKDDSQGIVDVLAYGGYEYNPATSGAFYNKRKTPIYAIRFKDGNYVDHKTILIDPIVVYAPPIGPLALDDSNSSCRACFQTPYDQIQNSLIYFDRTYEGSNNAPVEINSKYYNMVMRYLRDKPIQGVSKETKNRLEDIPVYVGSQLNSIANALSNTEY